jgi:hypothetical protein
MPTDLLYPDEIDARLNWPPGRTSQLARRSKLPHYRLPDGSIRLRWEEVARLVRHIGTTCAAERQEVAGA